MGVDAYSWPGSDDELVEVQYTLAADAEAALAAQPWTFDGQPAVGGCFVAFARGESGPGHRGDRAWAAAVSLRGRAIVAQSVAVQQVPAAYAPGLLARREGPILQAAVGDLRPGPDVLLVDATGLDHPRGAGLALHLGAILGVPTVGVTHRTLVASGAVPEHLRRGATAPVYVRDRCVGYWVCTKTAARAVVAHAGWRTSPETAAETVLAASSSRARTPLPLRHARRVARTTRASAGAG
ncbi:endonuclease V [Phytoactinopolyspora halotolerans]|uniref:Endonuclease V n=1 Tax=Phytoactinopolyspora halotolerans TaxID=1981512 RepID=A0A6L9SE53_9ACTN|nr:endonuclease V [Phytoactinopolyspora halotolerans]NEE02818.1 endonuclease V [Phytoactinopolyspora halotolerans]